MDIFLSVHLQKQYLLITLLINLLILFKWTLLERSQRSLLRSLVVKSLIDNIFIEGLGLRNVFECGNFSSQAEMKSFKSILAEKEHISRE